MLLTWLTAPLEENELDWLLSTNIATSSREESAALQAYMRALRRNGLQRTQWTLEAFIRPLTHTRHDHSNERLPTAWVQRIVSARHQLTDLGSRQQGPLDWAALVPQLLALAGWPGEHRLSSAEFQAIDRWEQAIDTCGSLGFDGRRIAFADFLSNLARTLDETLFAPESRSAPILIAGPTESAGLTADAIWFLGADEDAWPAKGSTHPLLPLPVQREAAMPHSSPQQDWDLAHSVSTRLLASASIVNFSFAAQSKDSETRPSRLITQLAGSPSPLPSELKPEGHPGPIAVSFTDASQIPFPHNTIEGGAAVLTSLSQCAFKAFATSRLSASAWDPAEAGLTAAQRGQLLHDVLHAIWGGPPHGLRTLADLLALHDRKAFVDRHVQNVLRHKLPAGVHDRMPHRYLEIEAIRLSRLVAEWLDYEAARLPFSVAETEKKHSISIAGLSLRLRLDRIDRLNDDSLLVIDYKSGNVSPKSWDLPRPDDVQLPLYAGFAINPEEELGGLVFAKVRTGNQEFVGSVENPAATLFPSLKGTSSLVKSRLTSERLDDWQHYIEQLAHDFLSGRATVDPRKYPETCERCGLHSLCRVLESKDFADREDDPTEEEAADE